MTLPTPATPEATTLLPTSNTDATQISTPSKKKGTFPQARKPVYSFEQVKAALIQARGTRSKAAVLLGCDPATITNYCKRYPELLNLEDAINQAITDMARDVVRKHIEDGNLQAATQRLKAAGVYVDKTQISTAPGQPLQLALSPLDAVFL